MMKILNVDFLGSQTIFDTVDYQTLLAKLNEMGLKLFQIIAFKSCPSNCK